MLGLLILIAMVVAVYFWQKSQESAKISNKSRGETEKSETPTYPQIDESQLNDDLSSAKGIDYRKLRNCLAAGDFASANKETVSIFNEFIYLSLGTEYNRYVQVKHTEGYQRSVERIPRTDMCTIDRLWVKYSNGHFGLSVQYQIYASLYEKHYYKLLEFNRNEKINMADQEIEFRTFDETYRELFEQLQLNHEAQLIPNSSAPRGHLPRILQCWGRWDDYIHLNILFKRVKECLD
ncbi:MAG: GUN4 domain-containing protein [Oscillatoria princeps RMCB-10]|jgi:hypothetical protein|nr:GUN4 domain-containing protein [Oscillatoria princeps RMCB-10]